MNPCDNRIWENYVQEPVVQTWEIPQTRYRSHYEYACDPAAQKVALFWGSRDWGEAYSSKKKAYYPVVPYNTQSFHYAPVMGCFDFTRLKQTDVLDLVHSRTSQPHRFGTVSLGKVISPLLDKMGTIEDLATGESLGTCTLIAHNLVLAARHAVEGKNIRNLKITFGYTNFNGSFYHSGRISMDRVIEEDALCDYAIIQLKEPLGKRVGFVPLNTEGQAIAEPALLHYPLGKPLKVSVHAFVQTQYQTDLLLTYHDSDYFSSGGAYFDPSGRMIALHLGAQLEEETMNLLRYALPLEMLVRRNPHSLLGKFASGELSQAQSYTSSVSSLYLAPADHNYLIDEEGRESEKILRGLLTKELKKDKKIKRNKNGTISFSKPTLEHIASTYPKKFDLFKESSLGATGVHGVTRLYSVAGVIESDHTIPHNVWKSTTNPKMKTLLSGGGKRQGENAMPAITIPWEIHRNLLTTGGVAGYQAFHQTLIDLCDQDRIDDALIQCYQEYEAKGLNLQAYKNEIKRSLEDHVNLNLISDSQKRKIIKTVF